MEFETGVEKKVPKVCRFKIKQYLCNRNCNENRAFSSAGSEHLPYKQRVGGSNPSTPTRFSRCQFFIPGV